MYLKVEGHDGESKQPYYKFEVYSRISWYIPEWQRAQWRGVRRDDFASRKIIVTILLSNGSKTARVFDLKIEDPFELKNNFLLC